MNPADEERDAWLWLRRELTAELGITYRPHYTGPGRPRSLHPLMEAQLLLQHAAARPGNRTYLCDCWLPKAFGVSRNTVYRVLQRALIRSASALRAKIPKYGQLLAA